MNRNACPTASLSGGRKRPPYNIRHTGGKTGSGGPPQPLCRGWRLRGRTRFRRLCRAGVFARRLGFAPSQGFRDDTSTAARRRRFGAQSTKCRLLARRSSPTKHRAGFCRALQDISAANRQCTPQSAPCGASSSPYRGAFQAAAPRKASPAREGAAAAQKQPRTGALGAGLFCRDAGGPFGGQRPADSGVAVSETAASGVAGGASASSPRRHSRCSSSGICSTAQVPSSCCVISSSISGWSSLLK